MSSVSLRVYDARGSRKYCDVEKAYRAPPRTQAWGLIVYDEVHLLPAPVFKLTAELQARRRLGLTATLVREDGR
ncbi:MAG TPA: hypothetical protein VL242_22230, partial [Sorangium sp.]|nr:hypothetical protein [Sorangium sp.]